MPHAETAGAGFAGLAAAPGRTQRSPTVRGHECAPDLRAKGFAIGLCVLETRDVYEAVAASGPPVRRRLIEDPAGRMTIKSWSGMRRVVGSPPWFARQRGKP